MYSDKENNFEDDIPPLLFSFYKGLMEEGFTSAQAFTLTSTYFESVMSSMLHGHHQQGYVRPPEGQVEDANEGWPEEEDEEDDDE